jgi:hypothetical protein
MPFTIQPAYRNLERGAMAWKNRRAKAGVEKPMSPGTPGRQEPRKMQDADF